MQKLSAIELSKSFEGNPALRDVSFAASAGRVLAICGENGAGKSTLIRILSGALRPDQGQVLFDDAPASIESPRHAIELGIHTVHQELSLVPHLSVAENILLGKMPGRLTPWVIHWPSAHNAAKAALSDFGFPSIDTTRLVASLSVSLRQVIEIAKALVVRPKILILDEPTAVLSMREAGLLFRNIKDLTATGTIVLYISHRLEEIFEISDDVLVLKDGRMALSCATAEVSRDALINAMVGRSLAAIYPPRPAMSAQQALEVRGLTRPGVFHDVSFTINSGEILGVFGLVGSGRSDVARAISGAQPAPTGKIFVHGQEVALSNPRDAIETGIALVTEDRKHDGLALECSVLDNGGLASMERFSTFGVINDARNEALVGGKLNQLSVRPASYRQPVKHLSGGNQQKVVLAKWMLVDNLRILIFDEPTRGVDIGTRAQIYKMICELAEAGLAVLLVSSDMPEILGMAHTVMIMRAGRVVAQMENDDLDMEDVFVHAAGVQTPGANAGAAA